MGEYKRRRVFDQEFKRDAVRLVLEGGRRVRDVCRELGLHENVLHRWKNEYLADQGNAFPGIGRMKPHEEEQRRQSTLNHKTPVEYYRDATQAL